MEGGGGYVGSDGRGMGVCEGEEHRKSARMRGLANSMTSRGAWDLSSGVEKSRARLQCSARLLGRSTMECSGMACICTRLHIAGDIVLAEFSLSARE